MISIRLQNEFAILPYMGGLNYFLFERNEEITVITFIGTVLPSPPSY